MCCATASTGCVAAPGLCTESTCCSQIIAQLLFDLGGVCHLAEQGCGQGVCTVLAAGTLAGLINAAARHCIVLMLPAYEASGLNTVGAVTLATHCKLS
jgi:hypothetical protein